MPSTVNSPAPVHSYKLTTHSANNTVPTASTTAVQDKTVSLMFKPVSDVQGLGEPPGFKGKGQEGKGQGKDFMTLRKPLPLAGVRGFGG